MKYPHLKQAVTRVLALPLLEEYVYEITNKEYDSGSIDLDTELPSVPSSFLEEVVRITGVLELTFSIGIMEKFNFDSLVLTIRVKDQNG